jgi:hypothetical protein
MQCFSCDSEFDHKPRKTSQGTQFHDELLAITYAHLACPECWEAFSSDEQMVGHLKNVAVV